MFVAVVVTTDVRWRRIPNAATFPAIALGLALGALAAVPGGVLSGGLLDHVAGLVLAFVATFPLYAASFLKAGDVKLLMAIGALRGVAFLFYAFVYGSLIGGVIGMAYVVVQRVVRRRPVRESLHAWIPYGIALGLGALAALAQGVGR